VGGIGSGRWGGKPLVEHVCGIDVRSWAPAGHFTKARLKQVWEWRTGRRAEVFLAVDDGIVTAVLIEDGARSLQKFWLRHGSAGFGGGRLWAICPLCSNDVGIIYFRNHQMGCRRCLGLRYRSQRLSNSDRKIQRFHRLWQEVREADSGVRLRQRDHELFFKLEVVSKVAFADVGERVNKLRTRLGLGSKMRSER
jgi:hypothetical protein